MNNVFRWASLVGVLAVVLMMLPFKAEAAGQNELNYFQTSNVEVEGRKALRIEIGMTEENPDYKVTEMTFLRRQLIIDMKNTRQGKLKDNIALKGNLAKKVNLEKQGDNLRVSIDFVNEVNSDNYRLSTLPAERRSNKPFRIVIDVLEPGEGGDINAPGINGKTIVVDPGHGGSDSGAVGPTGVKEKSVSLAVSRKVQNLLTKAGAKVIMTRTTDVDVYGVNATDRQELQARCDVANRVPQTALFLSIHCNAFSNPSAHGMETYYAAGSGRGQKLAAYLNDELAKAGGLFNRGVKTANYYVLRHTSMPASLVELAFITNPREEKLLNSDAYQNKLAKAIVQGIARYFRG
ncbi:N-acetylmuramoyl-L-alanine amidase [Selenomonas sp. AE3005]|uniref:N-acetylmuramoyl-L-alanine amidase family protein n=1 Tax=Selenomonas sp. AE3005 TaxID=1485543 RepID=UPI0025D5A9A8|nr:N-acetylmuramoyl-L-alanine amidase [Selenomonas sp. AE3005]